ncbi:MAG: response regulator [Thermodesulfobacteriota bacterium]
MANILIMADRPEYEAALPKGHKIFSFTDQASALDCARSQKLDLALVQADLPAGLEVLKELRQANPEVRVLTVMDAPSLPRLREAVNLGVQEILFTPLDREELEAKITKVAKTAKRNLKEALALQ